MWQLQTEATASDILMDQLQLYMTTLQTQHATALAEIE